MKQICVRVNWLTHVSPNFFLRTCFAPALHFRKFCRPRFEKQTAVCENSSVVEHNLAKVGGREFESRFSLNKKASRCGRLFLFVVALPRFGQLKAH